MISMWRIAGLAAGVFACSSALAQGPAPSALGSSASAQARVNIVNDTDYSLFTQTLGADLHCMKAGVPALSVPPRQTTPVPMQSGSCTGHGLQTFVIGAPGPELRLNMPFTLGRGQMVLGQGALPFFSVTSTIAWNGSSYDATWRVSCRWADCRTQDPMITVQNQTGDNITLQLRFSPDPNCPDTMGLALRSAPARNAGTIPVRACDGMQAWDLSTGGSIMVGVANGRYQVDLVNGQGNLLSKTYGDDGAMTVTVAQGVNVGRRP